MMDVYMGFVDLVESLNWFWKEVADLTGRVTVVEPEVIQPTHTTFRFALGLHQNSFTLNLIQTLHE